MFRRNFASEVMLPNDIFPEHVMEIDQEMSEKITNQTRTENNTEKEEETSE